MNIGEIAAAGAGVDPAAEALVEFPSGRRMTFGELDRRVEGLTSALVADSSVKPGDRIAILAMNCIEYVEVFLAAARAGMIAQGLNWRLAAPELKAVLKDSDAAVLVISDGFSEIGDQLRRELDIPVHLEFGSTSDGSYERYLTSHPSAIFPDIGGKELALLMYTGGSTGVPKGVAHTHESCWVSMAKNTIAERIVPSDRYLLLGQMFHSAAILVLNYLANGAAVVLLDRFEARRALEAIEAERATAFLGFTTMIKYLLDEVSASSDSFNFSTLRNLQYGGGTFAPQVIESLIDVFSCGVIQCYGTTEHVGVTFLTQEDHLRGRAQKLRGRLGSAGRPAALTDVGLFDDSGQRVPADGTSQGEVFVRSRGNMVGYWNKPEVTAEIRRGSFLGTGDTGIMDSDGYLYIVGRSKDVIRSGSENIYAAQVERTLELHHSVLESAVIGVPDETWGEIVTAFVVCRHGATVAAQELQALVSERLASYQKPRIVRFVDSLPKTAAGKLDKKELRQWEIRPEAAQTD